MPPIRTPRRQRGSSSESRRTLRRYRPYPRPDAARGPSEGNVAEAECVVRPGLEEPNMGGVQNVDQRSFLRWDAHACWVAASIVIIIIIIIIISPLIVHLIARSMCYTGPDTLGEIAMINLPPPPS
ncbi:hypothetical protein PLEOSDRAFT_163903 [Pleurotus ostreatus PC15]|uniref:Uncharacterized protein n=1 Tax=Pleurotus ostreatus (strain PC15) TaxID=1137138 RepID=A0A067PED3_PLEO1|nr:hypothetical protein PLEOSDRAFT_163903 [Pleurotus ostreatus PC15]